MSSIDNSSISDGTIDGDQIQEITVDGDIVWGGSTAFIDSFEDGNANEWTEETIGNNVSWGVNSGWASDGEYSIYVNGANSYGTFRIYRDGWETEAREWELSLDLYWTRSVDYDAFYFYVTDASWDNQVLIQRGERDNGSITRITENGTTILSSSNDLNFTPGNVYTVRLKMTDSNLELYVGDTLINSYNTTWDNPHACYPMIMLRETDGRIDNVRFEITA